MGSATRVVAARLTFGLVAIAVAVVSFAWVAPGGAAIKRSHVDIPAGEAGAIKKACGKGQVLAAPGFSTTQTLGGFGPFVYPERFTASGTGRKAQWAAVNVGGSEGKLWGYFDCRKKTGKLRGVKGTVEIPPDGRSTARASCPAGWTLISMGWDLNPRAVDVGEPAGLVHALTADRKGRKARATGVNFADVPVELTATGVCEKGADKPRSTSRTRTLEPGQQANSSVRCRDLGRGRFGGFKTDANTTGASGSIVRLYRPVAKTWSSLAINFGLDPVDFKTIAYCG